MKKQRIPRPLLMFMALASSAAAGSASAQVEVEPGVTGSLVRFEYNGNVTLDGHCFGLASPLPTGETANFFNGKGVAKNGSLFVQGSLNFNSLSFPDDIVVRNGTTPVASISSGGNLNLAGTCNNTSGCSNTTWEPAKWNDGGTVQFNNNCYNYGNDKITGTFAQPGRATGHEYTSFTVSSVQAAALSDGLTFVGWTFPGNNYDCGKGHLLFMTIAPGIDFHWMRVDQSGLGAWSHKPGGTPAKNVDNSNNTITNPLTADRGIYTDNGGFYCTCGGLANIN
jgi:hypothetical protein